MTKELMVRTVKHVLAVTVFLLVWEKLAQAGWIDPLFFGRPSAIASFIWQNFYVKPRLWVDLGYTLVGATGSFLLGCSSAFLLGLVFAVFPPLYRSFEPYLTLMNAMPRLALAPLFLLWFGLGLASKIAVGTSICFFIVLSATIAGIRTVNSDHVTLSRAMGGSPAQIFFKVTLPSAVPVIFAALRLSAIYALIAVIGAELIAAERGLGQTLAYLQTQFQIDGVLALLLILAFVGLVVTSLMDRLERKLLAWQ
jgi:NitT/TauT family transport system permease protein